MDAPEHGTPFSRLGPWAARERRLLTLVYLAWRNLWRNPMRSLLTAGAMVAGITLMIGSLSLVEGLFRQMVGFATNVTVGQVQVHREAYIDDQSLYALLPDDLVTYLRETTPHRYAPRLYAAGLAGAGDYSSGALLRGIEPAREREVTTLDQRVRKGHFDLATIEQAYPYGRDEPPVPMYPAVIGLYLAETLRIGVGDELVLITQAADGSIGNGLFHVTGIMAPIDPGFDRMGVLLSRQGFNTLMALDGGAHELAVAAAPGSSPEAAQDDIRAALAAWPQRDTLDETFGGPVVVRTWRQINPVLANMIQTNQVAMYILAVIIFAIAALGILNTMLMAIHERRHELGILLALGMGRGAMLLMVLLEAVFLALVAAGIGAVTGALLAWYLQVYGIDFSAYLPDGLDFMGVMLDPVYRGHLLPRHVVISVVLAVVTTVLAALVPSWRTARLRPVDVMRR